MDSLFLKENIHSPGKKEQDLIQFPVVSFLFVDVDLDFSLLTVF